MKEDLARSVLGGLEKRLRTSGHLELGFRATHMFTDTPEIEWVNYIQEQFRVNAKHLTLKREWKNRKAETSQIPLHEADNLKKLGVFFSAGERKQTGLTTLGNISGLLQGRACQRTRERIGPMLFGYEHLKNIIFTCGTTPGKFCFDAVDTT